MRKIVYIVLVIIFLIVLLFGLTACDVDFKNTSNETELVENSIEDALEKEREQEELEKEMEIKKLLVGKWKKDSLGNIFTYTFNEDGTGNYISDDVNMSFTYTIDKDELSIQYTGDTIQFVTQISVNEETLNVQDYLGNDTLYTRVKE